MLDMVPGLAKIITMDFLLLLFFCFICFVVVMLLFCFVVVLSSGFLFLGGGSVDI